LVNPKLKRVMGTEAEPVFELAPGVGDTRVTLEDKRRAVAQRAAEIAERRAVFDANKNN